MTQHTKGPWQANQSELEAHSALVEIRTAPNGDYKICDCGYQNAALIAAAPALYEALKAAEHRIGALSPQGYTAPELWPIREALRLAEGRG